MIRLISFKSIIYSVLKSWHQFNSLKIAIRSQSLLCGFCHPGQQPPNTPLTTPLYASSCGFEKLGIIFHQQIR